MRTIGWEQEYPEIVSLEDKVIFAISPKVIDSPIQVEEEIVACLDRPIASPPLREIVPSRGRVLLIADDMTRPTPRAVVIPPVLDQLNEAGVHDGKIKVLIALGTHRAMRESEIERAFGKEVVQRVQIINHDFRDPKQLVHTGYTEKGTPIIVNRRVLEADFILGVGSIVPHPEAGWSGGCKIFQPGICGEETTAWTHMLATRQPDLLALAGVENNPVRHEIEQIALQGGLRFIVNIVFDGAGKVVKVVVGDPVQAHRAGVAVARNIFVRTIPKQADILVVDARPADIDYWQGIKPLAFATRAAKPGGIAILVGDFPDGISPIYASEFCAFGQKPREELQQAERVRLLHEGVCTEALYLHSAIMERINVICVSDGMSVKEKESLGFHSARTVGDALAMALEQNGGEATVGIILQGGDVLPTVAQEREERGDE